MFNKYFTPSTIDCGITIKCLLDFDADEKQKELLKQYDCKSQIWKDHSYRNSTEIANFIWEVLRDRITFLRKEGIEPSFSWSSEYDDEQQCLEINIETIEIPEPEITNCKNQPCPYKNYYGVCRNCEDKEFVKPDPESLKQYQEFYENFVKEVEECGEEYITLEKTYKISGYIPDIDEFDAILSSYVF